jgi:hypothetical protein
VATGDFNGDGNPDLVITDDAFGTVKVSVLLGNGDGTFRPAVDYTVGGQPSSVAVGDFNNDGKLDVVVGCGSNLVSLLLGNGDGTFQKHRDFATGSGTILSLAVGDFNGDGNLDIVTANGSNLVFDTVSILLGRGNGTFQNHVDYTVGAQANFVIVADFNNDGKLDLAVTNSCGGDPYCRSGQGSVSILLGNGDGTFQPQMDFAVKGYNAGSVAAGDFNGDGNLDLAVVDVGTSGSAVGIWLGNGDGTFREEGEYATADYGFFVKAGDFNRDGKVDLVVAAYATSTVSVLLGNGDGTFQPHHDYGCGYGPESVAVADFNKDGKVDFAVANFDDSTTGILLGNGDGTFQAREDYQTGRAPFSIATGDFNGDGKLDLVTANWFGSLPGYTNQGTVSVLLGVGDGSFPSRMDYGAGYNPGAVVVGDFNRDGRPDLGVVNYCGSDPNCDGPGSVSILLGNGDGTFQAHMDYPVGKGSAWAAVADFNRDGIPDLAVTNGGDNTVSILLGNGDGTFQPPVNYATAAGPAGVAVGDFNGDGAADLAVADFGNQYGATVSILLGNGDGTFRGEVAYATGLAPLGVAVGDFNRDGRVDLVVADSGSSSVSILLGNGDGTFQPHVDYAAGRVPYGVAVANLKRDGVADLVVAGYFDVGVAVLLGNGDGTFKPYAEFETEGYPQTVAIGDFNRDGQPDVAVANSGSVGGHTLSVLLNATGTRMDLTSAPNPSHLGDAVTFTARVEASVRGAGLPTGTVTFRTDDDKRTAKLADGAATYTTSKLTVGKHRVIAYYSGDSQFAPRDSKPITQRVLP